MFAFCAGTAHEIFCGTLNSELSYQPIIFLPRCFCQDESVCFFAHLLHMKYSMER